MWIEALLFALGIGLIFKGSDFFVDSSVAIAERTGLPRVVIGGTLVSLATTTPEITTSIVSGVDKVSDLAIGNALGSVAANLGLILAVAAVIRPFKLPSVEFRWRALALLGFSLLLFLLTPDLSLPRWRGLLLVSLGVAYLFVDYRRGRNSYKRRAAAAAIEIADVKNQSVRRIVFLFLFGLAMVVSGSILLVNSSTAVAADLGVPPMFIGLTMVAIGTSLPELATALTAIRKRVFDLSVGNLIGANVLNLTLVTGIAAAIHPAAISRLTQLYTFPAILVILTVFFLLVRTRNRLVRREGLLLVALYVAFIVGLTALQIE